MQAEHLDLARIGVEQAFEDLDGRRLAGAVRAEQAEALAARDLEIEAVDGDDVAVALDEAAALRAASQRGTLRATGSHVEVTRDVRFANGFNLRPQRSAARSQPARPVLDAVIVSSRS